MTENASDRFCEFEVSYIHVLTACMSQACGAAGRWAHPAWSGCGPSERGSLSSHREEHGPTHLGGGDEARVGGEKEQVDSGKEV